MATFDLLPAIDLRGGRVVRLRQGDFARETAYSDDPVEVAIRFVDRGARWLHVVDLDGARTGRRRTARVDRPDRRSGRGAGLGRGRRWPADGARPSRRVLGRARARAVVGTAALEDPASPRGLVAAHGADRIVVSLDVRGGLAVGSGLGATVPQARRCGRRSASLADAGVRWFEVTAIDRDGTLEGPDLDASRARR